jgi:hypothetical protein
MSILLNSHLHHTVVTSPQSPAKSPSFSFYTHARSFLSALGYAGATVSPAAGALLYPMEPRLPFYVNALFLVISGVCFAATTQFKLQPQLKPALAAVLSDCPGLFSHINNEMSFWKP